MKEGERARESEKTRERVTEPDRGEKDSESAKERERERLERYFIK